jgi:ferredoxin
MSHAQTDVESYGTFDVADNKRLVLAIEQDAKVDILHACGGNARCTTCRVEFIDGEPSAMTAAEKERLEQRGLSGVRLSCQIVCDHDMTVRAISRPRRIRPARSRTDTGGDDPTAASVDIAVPVPRSSAGTENKHRNWHLELNRNVETRTGNWNGNWKRYWVKYSASAATRGPIFGLSGTTCGCTPAASSAAEQIGPTAATTMLL